MKLLSAKVFASGSWLLAVLVVLVSGCGTTSEPVFTVDPAFEAAGESAQKTNGLPPASAGGRDTCQVGNTVLVIFSELPETIPPHEEQIKEDGTLTLPYIGPVKAVGKQAGELQKEIHALYVPKIYRRLTVTVRVLNAERFYSVLGEVRQPGQRPYADGITVTKAIGAAGGLTEFASRRKISLTRQNGTKIKVNYKEAIADPKKDPQVFPGDSINVEKSPW